MKKTVSDIFYSTSRRSLNFINSDLEEALKFGFFYIESEDHIVEYIVANPEKMKEILGKVQDAKIKIENDSIGELWTAKLLVSDKLKNTEILFSNNTFSAVINLNLNSNRKGPYNAYIYV